MSYLPLSSLLLFFGLAAPAVILEWGRQGRLVWPLIVKSTGVALLGSGALWAAVAPLGGAPVGVVLAALLALVLAIYQAQANRTAARVLEQLFLQTPDVANPTDQPGLAEEAKSTKGSPSDAFTTVIRRLPGADDQQSTKPSLTTAFAPWGPLAALGFWFFLAFIPLLGPFPRIGSLNTALARGIETFAAFFGAWIFSTYKLAMATRHITNRREKDSVFGSLYAYYGLLGSAVILMGCHQFDIVHQARSLNLLTTGMWFAIGLCALGMLLNFAPERNMVLRWLPTVAFAGATCLVGVEIESLGVPDTFPLVVGLIVALALVDAVLSSSHLLHRVEVTLPRFVRVVAPAVVGAVGFYWYLARVWALRDGGRVSSADQADYLIILGLVTLVSLALVTHRSIAGSGTAWMTENSGTFNVAHDLLLTYACVLLGMVMPVQSLLFGGPADLVNLISLLAFGSGGAVFGIVIFAIFNYRRHAKKRAATLDSEVPELAGDGLTAWNSRMRGRLIRQVVGLAGIAVSGWIYVAYHLLVVGSA